eukprot:TRINITY_DN2065_c0_g1_i1.p2 TRINITY_DN2065_c0_g1~~TRINITY_DN2065_c0_g1_i1.p2  ORF type:complete len:115 (+),score=22.18 TRINITY_DN2065_c0_g1_i1:256-600(+)
MDLQVSPETRFLTVDGAIGLEEEEGRKLSRNMFIGGFFALPWLWFVNCYYFWPVLRYGGDSVIRKNTVRSLIGFILFTALLLPWTLTFAVGGEKVIGPVWKKLAVYVIMPENLA